VEAVAASGGILYVGGRFGEALTEAGRVVPNGLAQWDGARWTGAHADPVYHGLESAAVVTSVVVAGTDVYVGGAFGDIYDSSVAPLQARNVAKWDAVARRWEALGGGLGNAVTSVAALTIDGTGLLYAGGSFTRARNTTDTLEVGYVAVWDGTRWATLGGPGATRSDNGVTGRVNALSASGTDVYVGGDFTGANGPSGSLSVGHVVKWTGTAWTPLGGPGTAVDDNGVSREVEALLADGSALYVGGVFTEAYAGGTTLKTQRIAKWTGAAWTALGGPGTSETDNGVRGTVRALAVADGTLFVGGTLGTAYTDGGSLAIGNVVRWTGSAWQPLGGPGTVQSDNGVDDDVRALTVIDGILFVGGAFQTATGSGGQTAASGVVAFNLDIERWYPLGRGVGAPSVRGVSSVSVGALAGTGPLYVGGIFDRAGGQPASSFAAFNEESARLPVELAGLTARLDGPSVRLRWQTASETNNAGFHVERAVDDGAFAPVHFVDGAGTTSAPRAYRFVDAALPVAAERLTYRLRQVDLDGTATLSRTVVVRLGAPERLELHAPFPNPAREAATLRYALPRAGTVQVAVYNVLGQQVATLVDEWAAAGRVEQRLDTSRWASGLYVVRLTAGDEVRTRRLVVVR
jgi:hypothetical protein